MIPTKSPFIMAFVFPSNGLFNAETAVSVNVAGVISAVIPVGCVNV